MIQVNCLNLYNCALSHLNALVHKAVQKPECTTKGCWRNTRMAGQQRGRTVCLCWRILLSWIIHKFPGRSLWFQVSRRLVGWDRVWASGLAQSQGVPNFQVSWIWNVKKKLADLSASVQTHARKKVTGFRQRVFNYVLHNICKTVPSRWEWHTLKIIAHTHKQSLTNVPQMYSNFALM